MKTSVYAGKDRRFVVEPVAGGVSVSHEARGVYCEGWAPHHTFTLTPDQAGALIFGMEQALEVGEVAAQREAA